LKLRGAGEWLFEKHGTAKRRAWRKLHIGIDADTGEIVAFDLTNKDFDDASHVETLLEQLDEAPASFMADGAYDRASVLDAVLAGNPSARFVVPPCKGAVTGPTAATSPTQRDRHILWVEEHRRMNWQKASGYNKRSKVEAAINRYKSVIGDALNSRHDAPTCDRGCHRGQIAQPNARVRASQIRPRRLRDIASTRRRVTPGLHATSSLI